MQSSFLKILSSFLLAYFLSSCILIGMPWTYLLGFFVGLGFLFVFFKSRVLFLGVLLFFRPGIDSFLVNVRFSLLGIDLGLAGVFSLLIIIMTFIAILSEKDETFISKMSHPVIKLYALFCLFLVFNAFYSYDKVHACKIVLRFLSILAVTALVIMSVRNNKDAFFLLKSIAWSFVPCIVIGFLTGVSLFKEVRGLRYCATLGHPNILAFYLVTIMACFLTGLYIDNTRLRTERLKPFAIILLIVMLLFTRTRSGYAAFVILFLAFAWEQNRRLILPILAICAFMVLLPNLKSDLGSLYNVRNGEISLNEETSLAWRLEKWGILLKEAIHSPVFGHGMDSATNFSKDKLVPHNDYVRFFLESGVIGLFLYFAPFFYLLRTSLQRKKTFSRDSLLYKMSNYFIIFIISFLIMSISENLASYVIVQWSFWVIVGIFISLTWRKKHGYAELS